MLSLLSRALRLLPSTKVIRDDFSGPLLFVGDLHGDPMGLKIARRFLERGNGKVVFLGDYADRGRYQRETLRELFTLLLDYPDRVILLRGNHEIGPPGHPRYAGPVFPYDVKNVLTPEELSLYEEIHVRLPVVYLNEEIGIIALHGFISASLLSDLPREISPEEEFYILWSDSDPLSTEFRGVSVPDPWDWSKDRVEKVLEERGLFLLKGHSPHELKEAPRRIIVLFAHCRDTGGYYDYGVRYALVDGEMRLFEEIPCGEHRRILRSLEDYLSVG